MQAGHPAGPPGAADTVTPLPEADDAVPADLPEPSGALDTRTLSRSLFLRLRELAAL